MAVDLNRGGGKIRNRMDTVVILSLKKQAKTFIFYCANHVPEFKAFICYKA
jgi:hypothetical protein